MSHYHVNEIFKTIQGEGYWTGREQDRAKAVCQFCDTDFTKSTKYDSDTTLVKEIVKTWGSDGTHRVDYNPDTGKAQD